MAEVSANILRRNSCILALAHPTLILLLLGKTAPEDLEGLPYGLLADWLRAHSTRKKRKRRKRRKNTTRSIGIKWTGLIFCAALRCFFSDLQYFTFRNLAERYWDFWGDLHQNNTSPVCYGYNRRTTVSSASEKPPRFTAKTDDKAITIRLRSMLCSKLCCFISLCLCVVYEKKEISCCRS